MTRRAAMWLLGALAVVLGTALIALDLRMQQAGGWGGLDLQFAGSQARVRELLADWGRVGASAARFALWLDFAYLLVYAAFWALAVAAVRDLSRRRSWRRFAAVGTALVGFPIGAAALDAVEDTCLLLALGGRGGATAPVLAAVSATGKLLLLAATIAYVLAGLARRAYERSRLAMSLALGALAFAVAALVANAVVTSAKTERADAGTPGQIVDLPGGDLHVIDQGHRGDSAVILIPGYTGSVNWWERAAQIVARGRRVIRVDLLGHGASEKPKRGYGMDEQARRVADAARKLGVRRAVVAGHSLGGNVAVAMAEQDRELVRGVMVIGTPSDNQLQEGPGTLRLLFTPVVGQALYRLAPDSAAERRLEYAAFAGQTELPERWVDDSRRVTYTAFVRSGWESFQYRQRALDRRMAATGRPVLVLFGRRDRAVNPAAALHWDGARLEVVRWPGVGHTPQYERPRETAALILRFARTVLDRPG